MYQVFPLNRRCTPTTYCYNCIHVVFTIIQIYNSVNILRKSNVWWIKQLSRVNPRFCLTHIGWTLQAAHSHRNLVLIQHGEKSGLMYHRSNAWSHFHFQDCNANKKTCWKSQCCMNETNARPLGASLPLSSGWFCRLERLRGSCRERGCQRSCTSPLPLSLWMYHGTCDENGHGRNTPKIWQNTK